MCDTMLSQFWAEDTKMTVKILKKKLAMRSSNVNLWFKSRAAEVLAGPIQAGEN